MPIFTPPTRAGRPLWTKRNGPAFALFRHYAPQEEGINVYVLADGTVTTDDGVAGEAQQARTVSRTYHGGHIHTITSAEAAVLTSAGYGANIT